MVPKNFEIGDLVWAKMKGYPYWPGKITLPPSNSKAKKSQHYVYFFGSENYAWILNENIEMHDDKMVEKYTKNQKRFFGGYLNAVEEIKSASKNVATQIEDSDKSSEVSVEKANNISSGSKKKITIHRHKRALDSSPGEQKKNGKKIKHFIEKPPKKDSKRISSVFYGRNSGSPKSPKKDDDYEELIRNIPPNNAYSSESLSSSDIEMDLNSKKESADRSESLFTQAVNEFSKSKKVEPTSKKIGFLGLGNMGKRIVKNLVDSGHNVMVWNRSSANCDLCDKVEVGNSAADILKACDITFSCMANEKVSKNLVLQELMDGFDTSPLDTSAGEKKGFVDLTTLDPETSQFIDQNITLKGGRYLEAQITGTWEKAENGTLFILTAGDNSLFSDCESCFSAMGETTLYLGTDAGIACKMNILQNMLLGTGYAAMAESFALIEAIGLGASDYLDILSNGPINSPDIISKGHAMIEKKSTINIPLKTVQKHILFALELGSTVEQPTRLTSAANEAYKRSKVLELGDHDVSAIFTAIKD